MENDQEHIRLSLRYGLLGALLFPFIYESYANIMHSFAIAVAAAGCIYAGARFARYGLVKGIGAAMCFVLLSGGLGAFLELMVHSHVVSYLEKHSKYFYMDYKEVLGLIASLFVCYLLMFIACMARIGILKAMDNMKKNSEESGSFIDNAFGDDDE